MTRTIKIAVVEGDAPPGQINIRFSNVQEKKEAVITVPVPNDFISEEIRWYLEDFAQYHPFERERAKDAENALIDHGKNLAFYIHCSNVLESSQSTDQKHTLLVEIEDSPKMPPSMLWEALERKSTLDLFANVGSAIVTRVFRSGPLGHGLRDIALMDCNGEPNILIILIVSARSDLEADIPHRLVAHEALSGLDAISNALPVAKEFTRVEVVHPATFDAFQSHLEGQQPGYFSLVHLDLHGVKDDSGSVKLDFIKGVNTPSGEFTCVRDPRSAEEVGELLERNQVGRVVLNACRSTHESGPLGTLPRVFRRHGVHEIVAMSYQVLSRCVQHFTSSFYAVLSTTRSLPLAVFCGRKSLELSADRLSRFGTKLQIMDHIVPVCYQSQEWIQRDELTEIASAFSKVTIDNDSTEDESVSVFGREHDLLRLECMLLEGGRPVLVLGEPGVGKTVLLAVLAQWWSTTGCAVATHTVQLSQDKAFTVDKMCRDLHETFKCPGPYDGQQSIVLFLQATRFLVIIDSLESMTVEDSTNLREQRIALAKFIKALRSGKTVLLLGSRQEYNFLSSYTSPFLLLGLNTTPAIHLMRAVLKMSRKNVLNLRSTDSKELLNQFGSKMGMDMANEDFSRCIEEIEALKQRTDSGLESLYVTWDTEEDGIYLEEIHKLVNGNPLALGLLTHNMLVLGPEVLPKRFMLRLLQGAPMIINSQMLSSGMDEEIEGRRSLIDLDRLVSNLRMEMPFRFKHLIGLLATFWKIIPARGLHLFQRFQLKESVTSGDRNAELIALFDKLESADLGKNMSPNLKEAFVRLRTEKLDILEERQIQLGFYEYLEAEGLFEMAPEMKPLLKVMRETLSRTPSIDAAAIEMDEAFSSHEGTFMLNGIRDDLLEKSDGLDDEARGTIRSWDTWEDVLAALPGNGIGTELHEVLTSARSSVLQPGLKALIDSYLIDVPSSDRPGEAEAGMEYIKISPLLTIMLRGQPFWAGDEPFVTSHKVALALLYAHRCQTWPASFPATRTVAWNSAKSEADIEFYNLASAAAISIDQIRDTNRGLIVEQVMMNTVMKLDWCLMTSKTGAPTVQMLWESCLDEAQHTIKSLESSGIRPQKKKWRDSFHSQPSEKDIPLEQRQTELRLFGRRSTSIVLAIGLLNFYNRFDDERTRRCSNIIKSTTRDIKKDSYPLEQIHNVISSKAWIMGLGTIAAESSVSKWSFRPKMTAQDITKLAEKLWPSTLTGYASKEIAVNNPDLDQGRLDPQTYAAGVTQFQENIQEIHGYVKSGNYDAARELLDTAFENEIEDAQNDQGHRAALLLFSSVVSAKQGRLSDALRDLEEFRRLSNMSGKNGAFTFMGTMTSFMRHALVWVLKLESKSEFHRNTRLEPCNNCYKQKGTRRCLGCLYTVYCSKDCQKKHWSTHKKVCKSFGSGYSL